MMIFTATASILSGLYSSPAAFAAGGGYAIASPTAPTIFASSIDVNMVEALNALPEITGASPEVFAFSSYEGHSFVVRGVVLDMLNATGPAFNKFSASGSPEGSNSAVIGTHLRSRLGLSPPIMIPLVGSYAGKMCFVNVVGYYETGTSLDDELLVSLDTARFLSGMSSQRVSIIRVSTSDPKWLSGLLAPEGARFTLFDMLTQKSQAAIGEPIAISVGVRNWGIDAGEIALAFSDGDALVANSTVSLNASQSDRIVAMLSFDSLGLHTITASIGGSFPVSLSINVTVVEPYLRISAPSRVALGETLAVEVTTYTSSVAHGAEVAFGTRTNTTDENGLTTFVADVAGGFDLIATLENFSDASTTVDVVDPASYPAEFLPSVVSFTLSPDTIKQSESATGVIVVENGGAVSGILNLTVYLDTIPYTVLDVSLDGLGSTIVAFKIRDLGLGSHVVQVATFSEEVSVQSWIADNPDLVQLVMRYGGSGSVFSAGSVPIYQAAKISEGNVAIALFAIGSISALLAVLAITSVFSKEIREARRRLGILKTIGAPRSAIRRLVFLQALESGFAGAAIGVSAGVVIVSVITRSDILVLFGHRFSVDLDANLLLLLLAGAVAISVSSALISTMMAVRETTISSIRKLEAEPSASIDVDDAIADE